MVNLEVYEFFLFEVDIRYSLDQFSVTVSFIQKTAEILWWQSEWINKHVILFSPYYAPVTGCHILRSKGPPLKKNRKLIPMKHFRVEYLRNYFIDLFLFHSLTKHVPHRLISVAIYCRTCSVNFWCRLYSYN